MNKKEPLCFEASFCLGFLKEVAAKKAALCKGGGVSVADWRIVKLGYGAAGACRT